ncbi:MAG: nucleotide disphospho-sugar-binding domain-containing protein, partial [Polyangiaceae bacterium]
DALSAGSLGRFGEERPGVYVTMGSSGDVSVLPKVIAALAPLRLDVLVTSAGRALPPLPRGVRVLDVVDGGEASKRAALVVCNGGASTAWQALANGTPVVGIPSNLDACLAMSCVSSFGAGVEVRPDATVERIRDACALAITSDAIRARADELRVSASRIVPNARFFAVLESVAGFGRHAWEARS